MTIAVNRNLSNREKARKKNFGASTGNLFFFFRAFLQLLKLRFTAMVTYSFHLYSLSSHHFILHLESAKKGKSTGDKGPSVAPIAAGVGVTVLVIGGLAALIIYRIRR